MPSRSLVAVKCRLFPAMFASERTFEVALADGSKYNGIAPRHFCWNALGQIVRDSEETDDVAGNIAAKLLYQIDDEQAVVEVPDGEALAVSRSTISDRPTQIRPPAAKEPVNDVSVRP